MTLEMPLRAHARTRRGSALYLLLAAAVLLAACSTPHPKTSESHTVPPDVLRTTSDILAIPEPSPIAEPRSKLGNPAFYEVFGKRYFVLASAAGYAERGVASWYGPGFHKERTATGDPYDMYAMTAAHKTLPLPCYARVTNLSNGRSVIVRINDRGPFKDDRIIDLSYTAATKLDMVKAGTALVEVRVVSDEAAGGGTFVAKSPLYVQAGAFSEPANAEQLVTRLKGLGLSTAFVVKENRSPRDIHRVRIGPIANAEEFDRVVAKLRTLGIEDARLAGD